MQVKEKQKQLPAPANPLDLSDMYPRGPRAVQIMHSDEGLVSGDKGTLGRDKAGRNSGLVQ